MNDALLPIGRFARLAGLTVGALRHYDEQGVLVPADVDPSTGYRRYRADQVATARAVAALRDLELSLPAIRALLEAGEAVDRAAILATERRRLEARTARLQRALHRLSMLSAGATAAASPAAPASPAVGPPRGGPAEFAQAGSPGRVASSTPSSPPPSIEVPAVPTPPPTLDPETHRALGAGLFNRTWTLLEIEDRTPTQDAEMIDTAHASAWHWRQVGNAANEARGHWIIARVYSVLGHADEAVYHARRANAVLEAGGEGIEDWDAAAAAEALARALAVGGDAAGAAEWKARAAALLEGVADAEERAVVEGDLATIPG